MGKAEEYLDQIPMWTRKKNSLQDVRALLEAMGSPDRRIPAIHVAGTNGKGSVCAFLTSVFREAGYKTGTFISPHLVEIRERFLINGRMADSQAVEESFERVLSAARAMMEKGYCHPTFFEFLFYMAMDLFEREKVDIMIIETGLGGRLDTTNVLEHPLAAVITSISKDHTAYLGNTIAEIAGEKAGIVKPGVPVIYDGSDEEASRVIEHAAVEKNSPRIPVGQDDFVIKAIRSGQMEISARMMDGKALNLLIPFEARYQAENAMLAVRTLEVLQGNFSKADPGTKTPAAGTELSASEMPPSLTGLRLPRPITAAHLTEGVKKTLWPGRMEQARPGIYLDGAHNPGGIRAFLETAKEMRERQEKKAYLLFAAVSDKDYEVMAEELTQGMEWAAIGVVHMNSDRGLSAGLLAELFRKHASCQVTSYEDTGQALADMERRAEGGLLFCAGSLYLIGEIKACMKKGSSGIS